MVVLKCVTGDLISLDVDVLKGAVLDNRDLHRLIARGQDFTGASFVRTKLREAILDHSVFENASFRSTVLINTIARACHFSGAVFQNAIMLHAQFDWSNFSNATFQGAQVKGASFDNCWICGADFSEAVELESATFNNAIFDQETRWPENFLPSRAERFQDLDGKTWTVGM